MMLTIVILLVLIAGLIIGFGVVAVAVLSEIEAHTRGTRTELAALNRRARRDDVGF
jgi:hypothetical protein